VYVDGRPLRQLMHRVAKTQRVRHSQITFHKAATNYRALVREKSYEDQTSAKLAVATYYRGLLRKTTGKDKAS